MRRGIGLFVTISLGMLIVLEAPRVVRALSQAQIFRVVDVSVEGAQHLTRDEVLAAAAIPARASIWDDMEPLAVRLRSHPLIREVRIRRRLPGRLVLEVWEREPVALLLPSPTLMPVDRGSSLAPHQPSRASDGSAASPAST